jgi:hypothetical protein
MNRHGFSPPEFAMVMLLIGVGYVGVFHVTNAYTARAREASCRSNLRQLVIAARAYAADFDALPTRDQGALAMMAYIKNQQIFQDPAGPAERPSPIPPEPPLSERASGPPPPSHTDYLFNSGLHMDDPPYLLLATDNLPTRHQGRWLGTRLDGACFVYPARQWPERMNWVTTNAH